MRSTSRLTGAAKLTIERLMVAAGKACADLWADFLSGSGGAWREPSAATRGMRGSSRSRFSA